MPASVPQYVPLNLPSTYRRFTRREGGITFSSGQPSNSLRIDQSGTLLGLLLTFNGTVTIPSGGTTPTLHAEFPYNLIKRVNLTGGGPGRIVSIPAYVLNVLERVREQDYVDAYSFTPAGASTTQPITFDVHVPVCVRDGDLYGDWSDYLGSIFTGDPSLQLSLQLEFNSETQAFTNQSSALATVAGTFDVWSFKLDTPTPADDFALLTATSWSHQLIAEQENIAIAAAGVLSTVNPLPSAQPRAYLRVLDIIRNGSNPAPANGILASAEAELQDTITFERAMTEQVLLARQRRRYVATPPAGTYVLDFAAGNRRDNWLPVGSVSLFKWTPTISSASLTSASLSRYSEVVVPSSLVAPWMQLAAAKGNLAKWAGGSTPSPASAAA